MRNTDWIEGIVVYAGEFHFRAASGLSLCNFADILLHGQELL